MDRDMMRELNPLLAIREGQEGIIHSITGGRGLISRLAAMGIAPGIKIKVVRNSGGPLLIATNGAKVAIGRGQASKIIIISLSQGNP
ncbi:MAG: FeoA domain-containing protein [Nitrospirota bacterium]